MNAPSHICVHTTTLAVSLDIMLAFNLSYFRWVQQPSSNPEKYILVFNINYLEIFCRFDGDEVRIIAKITNPCARR